MAEVYIIAEKPNGDVCAEKPNPAVSNTILKEIYQLRECNISMDNIIDRLRTRTVPSGYTYHTWKKGVNLMA